MIYTAVSDPWPPCGQGDGTAAGNIPHQRPAARGSAAQAHPRHMPEATKIAFYSPPARPTAKDHGYLQRPGLRYGFEIAARACFRRGHSLWPWKPAAQVDCLTNLTDNTVVCYLTMVRKWTRSRQAVSARGGQVRTAALPGRHRVCGAGQADRPFGRPVLRERKSRRDSL